MLFQVSTPVEDAKTYGADTKKETGIKRIPTAAIFLFLLGTLTGALFAFVVYPHQNAVEARIDLNGFGILGRHIAWGHGFSLGYGPTIRRAPLYPGFVALILTIFRTNIDGQPDSVVYRPVLIAQCFILGLTCVTVWVIARKLFGERTGMTAGVLCALAPQCLRYVGMTEVETSMGLLIALMALTGLNLYRRTTPLNGFLFAVVCAAASLVKPVAMLYPLFFCLLILWRKGTGKGAVPLSSQLPALAATLGVFVLCLLPWCIRNFIVTHGEFKSISSNGPGEFLRGYVNAQPKFYLLKQDFGGNVPDHVIWDWQANLYEDAILQRYGLSFFSKEHFGPQGEKRPMEARIDLELSKEKAEAAEVKQRFIHEPLGVIQKFLIQIFMFWYVVETRTKSLLIMLMAAGALSLGAFGWIRAHRKGIDVVPIVSVVIYFNLLYAFILAFARYSMPVYPVLLVMTAYGLVQLGSGFSANKNRSREDSRPA